MDRYSFTPGGMWVSMAERDEVGHDFVADFINPGDVNGDRKIDITDAVLALQVMAGTGPQGVVEVWADVDGNGKIDMAEWVYISQRVADIR
jgi:hypothetical protein